MARISDLIDKEISKLEEKLFTAQELNNQYKEAWVSLFKMASEKGFNEILELIRNQELLTPILRIEELQSDLELLDSEEIEFDEFAEEDIEEYNE
jgi:hypothetical protein